MMNLIASVALFAYGVIFAALGAWLHSKCVRKVSIKFADIEAEAPTVAELDRLIGIRKKQ